VTTIYAVTTRDGTSEVTFDAMEAGEFGETDAEGELLSAPNQCDDTFFALADFSTSTPGLQPYKWYPADLPMRWYFNSGSNPGYLVLDNTEDSLKDGTAAWKTIFDACGMTPCRTTNLIRRMRVVRQTRVSTSRTLRSAT
jgi:hypothetical protein